MSVVSYTLVGKKHHCPMWDIDLTITAKYRFFDEQNPHAAKYAYCTCPITENLKLPIHEQDKKYSLFRFCKMEQECLKSIAFKSVIDIKKDDYSQ